MDPVIPGFYPDPSVCRVADDYYLVNSTFEYAPGVPIFHSTDLTSWTQIGHVLDRPSQLHLRSEPGGRAGIYAPTLRHRNGVFWMVTTNVSEIRSGHLIVQATDPAGPWSEPVYTTGAVGIDPDLAWDDDGTCYLTWCHPLEGILQATVIPETGRLTSDPAPVWQGTGRAHPEGPHLFRRGEFWYLLLAEGGTHLGHCVTIARSAHPTGPFEEDPGNPILSHAGSASSVQATGHADIIERTDGGWAMTYLGIRPRGSNPRWHVNGRETFFTDIEWSAGWPRVADDDQPSSAVDTAFSDDFTSALDHRWVSPGRFPDSFAQAGAQGLLLTDGRTPASRVSSALLGVRARDSYWTASVSAPRGDDLAFSLRMDDDHWIAIERVSGLAHARTVIGPADQLLGESLPVGPHARLVITTEPAPRKVQGNGPDIVVLSIDDGDVSRELARVDGRYYSTEVAGGFTGRVVGIEALGTSCVVRRFTYLPLPEGEV